MEEYAIVWVAKKQKKNVHGAYAECQLNGSKETIQ